MDRRPRLEDAPLHRRAAKARVLCKRTKNVDERAELFAMAIWGAQWREVLEQLADQASLRQPFKLSA